MDNVWQVHASRANHLARRMADGLGKIAGVQILYPVDANAVFAKLPDPLKQRLKGLGWQFYSFIGGGSRLMCSWATAEEDIEEFAADAAAFA